MTPKKQITKENEECMMMFDDPDGNNPVDAVPTLIDTDNGPP
jgi:hypothetical protein